MDEQPRAPRARLAQREHASSSPPPPAVPAGVLAAMARVSCLAPLIALALVGLSQEGARILSLSRSALIAASLAAAVISLSGGVGVLIAAKGRSSVRRQAWTAVASGAAILVLLGVAFLSGNAAHRNAEFALRDAARAALRDYPGWNGGALAGRAELSAFEIDPAAELAGLLLRSYGRAYRLVVFGVDNRSSARDLTVDLGEARVQRANGTIVTGVARFEVVSHATDPAAVSVDTAPAHVAAGQRADGLLAFFAPEVTFADAVAIVVKVDGAPLVVQGRYFTREEKRAIDAARARR